MKRKIDEIRDSAISMEIESPDDPSPIVEMVSVADRMHVIKGGGIYRVTLADHVDPGRTNPAIPNSYQKILKYGADSEIVGKTLLTAKALFNPTLLLAHIDCKEGLRLSLEALNDIAAMSDIVEAIRIQQNAIMEEFNGRNGRSLALPCIPNLFGVCKDFIQKADHSVQSTYQMSTIFTGTRKGWFEELTQSAVRKYGPDDLFSRFLAEVTPFLKGVRNTRNAVEHRKVDQRVETHDFSLLANGSIRPPVIEVFHKSFHQPKILVTEYTSQMATQICDIFEMMLAFLCSKHIQSTGGIDVGLAEFPVEQRRSKHVRYGYASSDGFQVIGPG
jgi:hypothetical protein